jgi:hypothetical protein
MSRRRLSNATVGGFRVAAEDEEPKLEARRAFAHAYHAWLAGFRYGPITSELELSANLYVATLYC